MQRLIRRRVASAVAADEADVLLFQLDDEIAAVVVLEIDESEPSICDLHVVAISNEYQGSRTLTDAGELPLVKVVLDTAMAEAATRGATLVRTIVARDNARSLRMLDRQGFTRISRFDNDYDEYAARLT